MQKPFEGDNVVENSVKGANIKFYIADAKDTIQRHHFKGEFYEQEELELISKYFRPSGSFLDIGANVGNHSIFASKILNASRLILVEPNPVALAILDRNLALNDLDGETTLVHRCALSDHKGVGRMIPRYQHNLGATQVAPLPVSNAETGDSIIPYMSGDDIILGERIDFIKIDVEGQAVEVLRGLHQTIADNRPPIFVEIDDHVLPDFESWLATNRYAIVERYVRYKTQTNFMIIPDDRSTALQTGDGLQ